MTDKMKKNLELRGKIIDLGCEISGDIDHGECFYDEDMLKDFCKSLDRMKELASDYYDSNRKELNKE
ncbi:hypothetical protein [Bacillus cereus group sp. BfR-BA-01700]|uniref:hypothetical protein n=1 Tax=Bacillus cereus group sp. BfR-BA-01700 TaxID=3094884 RepID=UPI0029C27CBE|nr:hypothetical protein [Bacillus cereus group sp. BfR-BA-01700]MDX5841054.1 hypothetical protein [Bacillus cereus group sp. BfR-BA-01700]